MKNHKELFEALLAGEELHSTLRDNVTVKLIAGDVIKTVSGVTEVMTEFIPGNWKLKPQPQTKTINGIEVPAPRKTAPAMGEEYFTPTVNNVSGYRDYIWRGSASDTRRLMTGVIHMEPEHAAQHTKAILSLTAE
jgi:hypothetical protein